MLKEPVVHIAWSGHKGVEAAIAHLRQGEEVVLELPLAVHHALLARLRPEAATTGAPLQVTGDAALIDRVADIAGLEDLGRLAALVDKGWEVTVASPHPRIIFRRRGAA